MGIRFEQINGTIRCESGVRVGGSRDELEIGGIDNPVLREGPTHQPYLPGSSIKGRMRSLLERYYNVPLGGRDRNEPHGCTEDSCLFCKVFGPHKQTIHRHGPSRLIVRDAYLSSASNEAFQADEKRIIDVRTENMVNRLSNTAQNPRPVERVARGTLFDLALTLRMMDGDPEPKIKRMVRRGLLLLAMDGIGSGISRGHGQISISIETPQEWGNLPGDGMPEDGSRPEQEWRVG
jgi:CRISPR-associated protein Csm3